MTLRALSRTVGLSRSYRKTVWLVLFSQLKSHIRVCCRDKEILYINFPWRQLYHQFETQVFNITIKMTFQIFIVFSSFSFAPLWSLLHLISHLLSQRTWLVLVLQSSHLIYHYLKNPKVLRLESFQYLSFLSISTFSKESLGIILVSIFLSLAVIFYILLFYGLSRLSSLYNYYDYC